MRYHSQELMQTEIGDLAEMIRDCPEENWAPWIIQLLERLDSYSNHPDFLHVVEAALVTRLQRGRWEPARKR